MTSKYDYYLARAHAMETRAAQCSSGTRRADFLTAAEGWRALAHEEARRLGARAFGPEPDPSIAGNRLRAP